MRLTFRTKLLASHTGLVVAVMLIVILELYRSLAADLEHRLDERLEQQAAGAAQWITGGRRHTERLAARLAVVVDAQVTIVDKDGVVIGDADAAGLGPWETENQSGHPEIAEARSGRIGRATRVSAATGLEMKYVAVAAGDDLVVRLGLPLAGITATVGSLQRRLYFAAGLAVAAALALGLVASRIAARPLRAMTASASSIAAGDYDIPVATDSPDEFGMLSRSLAALAGDLKGRIGDLTTERDRLSAILAGMAEGVLVTDAGGTVIVANPAAVGIVGAGKPLVGARLDDAVPIATLRAGIARAADRGETEEFETAPEESDGRHLAVYARPLTRDAGGGTVAVIRDMTQLRRFETMRKDFVANVSHELRTPVTAIQGYAETMLHGTADRATAQQFLEIIHRHAHRLGRLLEDLLRLSEIEAKQRGVAVGESVPLEPIAGNVVETVRQRGRENDATVRIDIAGDVIAVGDADGLEQVIENLVDNALKYGKRGGVVRVEGKRDGDRVVLRVIDDGPGIEEMHLPRLFERFYRVDAGRSRERGGTGLGLAIVKHLVESMGGHVTVESTVGAGCCFTVDLPAARA